MAVYSRMYLDEIILLLAWRLRTLLSLTFASNCLYIPVSAWVDDIGCCIRPWMHGCEASGKRLHHLTNIFLLPSPFPLLYLVATAPSRGLAQWIIHFHLSLCPLHPSLLKHSSTHILTYHIHEPTLWLSYAIVCTIMPLFSLQFYWGIEVWKKRIWILILL